MQVLPLQLTEEHAGADIHAADLGTSVMVWPCWQLMQVLPCFPLPYTLCRIEGRIRRTQKLISSDKNGLIIERKKNSNYAQTVPQKQSAPLANTPHIVGMMFYGMEYQ